MLEDSKPKIIFHDNWLFEDTKSLYLELDRDDGMRSDMSSVLLKELVETPDENTKEDIGVFL